MAKFSVRAVVAGVSAAAFLTMSTVAAAESPASKLSLANSKAVRASTGTKNVSHQAGGFPFLIVFVVIAAGLGLYFAVKDDNSDSN